MPSDKISLSISIVVYKTDPTLLETALASIEASTIPASVYIVDNSPVEVLKPIAGSYRALYLHPGKNLGFGGGHNLAIAKLVNDSKYHLLLNPDISFGPTVLEELCAFMDQNPTIGWVMPNVLYPDGSRQELCKRLPTPWDLFHRRFLGNYVSAFSAHNEDKFKCRDLDLSQPCMVPNLSGCFALVRTSVIQAVGGFDERFFLYLEDTDLVRRIGEISRTTFYPFVDVYHVRGRGSYRDARLLGHHVRSAIKYFCKWGWFIDPRRRHVNRSCSQDQVKIVTPARLLS